jgi:hypothetical protein
VTIAIWIPPPTAPSTRTDQNPSPGGETTTIIPTLQKATEIGGAIREREDPIGGIKRDEIQPKIEQ